jgi:hypothetical protein
MNSTKKRPRSPGGDDLPQQHPKISTQPQAPHRYRGAKDKRLAALQKLERKRRHPILRNTETLRTTARSSKCTTGVGRAAVVTTGPQHSLRQGPSSPPAHIPLLSPIHDDTAMWEDFNDVPISPRVASQSSSPIGVRDNHTLLRQTYHLDKVASTWNTRRDSQAMQWKTTVIPRLIPVYLANRAETDSGRVPPSTKPVHQCRCKRVELNVELITWDRKFLHY